MGCEQDINSKALELIGCITPRLLTRKAGLKKKEVIRALNLIDKKTTDWQVRAACKRAIQMLSHRVH